MVIEQEKDRRMVIKKVENKVVRNPIEIMDNMVIKKVDRIDIRTITKVFTRITTTKEVAIKEVTIKEVTSRTSIKYTIRMEMEW